MKTIIALLFLTLVPPANAQTAVAGSFEQLQILIRPGDTVSVTDSAGMRASGSVFSLSTRALEVEFSGVRRVLAESDVTTIRQRRGDPLKNGALWGLVVGAGFAATAVSLIGVECYGDSSCAGLAATAIGVYGAIGAGIGTGVDALIKGQQIVYQSRGGQGRVRIAPLVTASRKGVRLSVDF